MLVGNSRLCNDVWLSRRRVNEGDVGELEVKGDSVGGFPSTIVGT